MQIGVKNAQERPSSVKQPLRVATWTQFRNFSAQKVQIFEVNQWNITIGTKKAFCTFFNRFYLTTLGLNRVKVSYCLFDLGLAQAEKGFTVICKCAVLLDSSGFYCIHLIVTSRQNNHSLNCKWNTRGRITWFSQYFDQSLMYNCKMTHKVKGFSVYKVVL